MLCAGGVLVLVGALAYPVVTGKPTSPAGSGGPFTGGKTLDIFLDKQCYDSDCEQGTSESNYLRAAYALILFGTVPALLLCFFVLYMAVSFPHSSELGDRLQGFDFKGALVVMMALSIVSFAGWLMIPLSFEDLNSDCFDNTTTLIHCGIPCDAGEMAPFILCGPYRTGSGAYLITVGMILINLSPLFARWWTHYYERVYGDKSGDAWARDDVQRSPPPRRVR